MAKLELREISEKLSASSNSNAVISSHINYLEKMGRNWKAAIAFYDCTTDRLVSVSSLGGEGLVTRDIDLPIDDLPIRLVRKFFHHSMVAQNLGKRLVLNLIFRNSPFYRVDENERQALSDLVPVEDWKSCVCFPLADTEDVIAMLILASHKRNDFPSRALGEILPLNSVAAMALAQHLYRAEKGRLEEEVKTAGVRATAALQGQFDAVEEERQTLTSTVEDQAKVITDLVESMSHLDRDSTQYRDELQNLKTAIFALEEQSSAATEHLVDAYSEVTMTSFQLTEAQTTNAFMRAVCDVLAQEHDNEELAITLLSWFCDYFGIDRFSFMVPDPQGETLEIVFARGINEEVVKNVKVRIGQGISGWVAHNRKPLLVQSKDDRTSPHTEQDAYNSDSFLSVPLVYNNILYGVINLSNKRDGSVFGDSDLDRAGFLAAFLAMSFDGQSVPNRIASRF